MFDNKECFSHVDFVHTPVNQSKDFESLEHSGSGPCFIKKSPKSKQQRDKEYYEKRKYKDRTTRAARKGNKNYCEIEYCNGQGNYGNKNIHAELKASTIPYAGNGVFALKIFKKGGIITKYDGIV